MCKFLYVHCKTELLWSLKWRKITAAYIEENRLQRAKIAEFKAFFKSDIWRTSRDSRKVITKCSFTITKHKKLPGYRGVSGLSSPQRLPQCQVKGLYTCLKPYQKIKK